MRSGRPRNRYHCQRKLNQLNSELELWKHIVLFRGGGLEFINGLIPDFHGQVHVYETHNIDRGARRGLPHSFSLPFMYFDFDRT